jgi:arginine-tRNA-protein transferase
LCVPIRVPIARFAPNKSQRRAWRKNQDLAVTITEPQPTDEKFDLYQRYQSQWHGKSDDDRETFNSFLYDSPVDTLEFCYRDPAGKLLAVGICDVCPLSLSSVYLYHDPAESHRGLGTFSALFEIEYAKSRAIPHWYLGYWVAGCAAMDYKAAFRPHEVLSPDGVWIVASSSGA